MLVITRILRPLPRPPPTAKKLRAPASDMMFYLTSCLRPPQHPRALAGRCPGIVDKERLDIIRECDAIFIGKLKEHGWYDKVWQAYAGLIPVKTVGVKGDERSYEWATNLRAVVSEDAMTADWVELPSIILRETSHKILNEVKGINRVLYDISTKPPASIEWE
jgi:GMP synthase (glutamine-hydrolysing)